MIYGGMNRLRCFVYVVLMGSCYKLSCVTWATFNNFVPQGIRARLSNTNLSPLIFLVKQINHIFSHDFSLEEMPKK